MILELESLCSLVRLNLVPIITKENGSEYICTHIDPTTRKVFLSMIFEALPNCSSNVRIEIRVSRFLIFVCY